LTVASATTKPILPNDHLLVVGDHGGLTDALRRRYPGWDITSADTYLAGISALTERPAQTVVAYVDGPTPQLSDAVAGLREAAGERTRLLLCCRPESEPVARAALAGGADDYILFPIQADELDNALGRAPTVAAPAGVAAQAPAATMTELDALADTLANLESEPTATLQRLAELAQLATGADGVTVVVHGSVVAAGQALGEPVLVEPIESAGKTIGQISLGPRAGRPYSSADIEKLRHYARLTAQLTQLASRHRHWRKLAMTDELSGLPNRRYLLRFLDDMLMKAEAERFCVTLLIFDIDDFKTYNDICGHEAGDEIIRLAANLFRRHCREHDLVTRYGGDEFAVVFWDAEEPRAAESSHPADALLVLQRFTQELGAAEFTVQRRLPDAQITISGGLATFPWDATTREELIRKADQALIQAKQAGKNRIFTIGQGAADEAGET